MTARIRVLHVVGRYPTDSKPGPLVFVKSQIDSLAGVRVACDVLLLRGRGPWKYAAGGAQIRRRLRERPADLIHAHYSYCGWVARGQGVPLVVSLLGSDLHGPPRGGALLRPLVRAAHRALARRLFDRADATIVKSEGMREELGRPAHVIPNGVDLSLFFPAEPARVGAIKADLGLDPDRRYVLFPNAVSNPVKRYDLARRTVEGASARLGKPIELLAVHGRPQSRLADYMRVCDLLLVTSSHEGSPNVVKEAMACNLPIVSVDVGDVRTRITGTRRCLVAADDRPETLASLVSELLHTGERSDGRDGIRALSLEAVAQRVRTVYEQVCGAAGAARV